MKKKILVGYIMDGTSGGIDRYLLRFIEQVWEEDIQIDFLSDRSAYELKKMIRKSIKAECFRYPVYGIL